MAFESRLSGYCRCREPLPRDDRYFQEREITVRVDALTGRRDQKKNDRSGELAVTEGSAVKQ